MTDAQERIGQSIGDYRLLRLLGKGSFGVVYLAEHLHDHSSVAVKVLHSPLTGHDSLHTFLNEARTMRLRHPHIVSILDFGLSRRDDLPYLVMTYASGGTLRDRYPKGSKLSHKVIDTYVQQLASALQYAHDHRIVHRDIKPENMLVLGDGTLQLSDFGIAKISELTSLSSQHTGAGTPAYTAPEQSQGKPSPASDQYALAIVVYEWLTGLRPFQGDPLAVMLQHYKDTPPSLSGISPDISPSVEQVIFKALAKDPQDRFPTITHFAEALHAALQEDATQRLPYLDEPRSTTSPMNPVPSSDAPPPQMALSGIPLALAETSPLAQPILESPPSMGTPDARSVDLLQSSGSTLDLQKRPSVHRGHMALIVFLCLMVLLLGGGGTTWRIAARQQQIAAQQQQTAHSVTATAIASASLATATAAANAYWAGVANNGVQFGFDAAHTHSNSYEQVLNTTNVTHITQLWSFSTEAKIFSSPAVANGIVYVGSFDHRLYAFDAACRSNCQPLWSFSTGGLINSSPAIANGTVYISSNDGKLYAFDAACRSNCQPLWSFSTGELINSSPTIANGIVYIGSDDGKLYAFDATCRLDCLPLWAFRTGNPIASSPAVANGIVYVGSFDHRLYAFDATCRRACQPLWSFTTGEIIYSSPAVANGIVYVGSYDRNLYAFDATCRSDCQPLWSFTTGGYIESSPAVANGMVYIGSGDSDLYTFDATCRNSCQPLWSFPTGTGSYVSSSPEVANGVVYIGSASGKLYAFDATCNHDCQPLWSFTAGSSIESSPVVANGVIYIGSNDGKLYALGLPTSF